MFNNTTTTSRRRRGSGATTTATTTTTTVKCLSNLSNKKKIMKNKTKMTKKKDRNPFSIFFYYHYTSSLFHNSEFDGVEWIDEWSYLECKCGFFFFLLSRFPQPLLALALLEFRFSSFSFFALHLTLAIFPLDLIKISRVTVTLYYTNRLLR